MNLHRDTQFVVKLPDSMDFPVGSCLMCDGTTIYTSIKAAQVPVGGSIAIIGIGGLGHIGTQLAKAMVCSEWNIDSQAARDIDLSPGIQSSSS